jgi:uncharacterized membrane protein YfcA
MILKKLVLAVFAGLIIGFVAGLIGVGGGEFRLPILVGLLDLPVFFASATNLIIGILVSLISFLKRYPLMTPDAFKIACAMGLFSLLGAYWGAHLTGKFKERVARYLLAIFLFLVGLKFILTPSLPFTLTPPEMPFATALAAACIVGFFIGIISGICGVAGGEFRIPILMGLFAMPIKLAGTVSSLVALPAQLGGLWKHHQLHHLTKEGLLIALSMGITSVIGSFLGATLVFHVNEKILESLLGVLLILAAGFLSHSRMKKQA